MFAPTASQMLRDDQRLRNLHRETIKRRKRFVAKQKKLENEEENRRIKALEQRRRQRHRHLASFRKNNDKSKPIRVQRARVTKIHKNNDEISSFIVPVCDQLSSPILSSIKRNKIYEKKTDIENEEEFDNFDNANSDHLSVAELDDFEMKHFGIQQSIQYNQYHKENKENKDGSIKKPNGYQEIFREKIDYEKDKIVNPENENNRSVLKSLTNMNNGSLFNINDIDMKTPEDNDSVKINPNDSIDCSKMSFSTVYNSNLLPLQSVLSNKCNKTKSKNMFYHKNNNNINNNNNKSNTNNNNNNNNKSYGIKLPRLTQSILNEKDRLDSKHRQTPKSTFSAPIWNRNGSKDIGYNIAMNRRRNTTTIIDDFFTKTSDEFSESHRKSNNTMFLPNINRSKLKPKTKSKPKHAYSAYSACSVMSEYDILREESKLQRSLLKINETLSNLTINDKNQRNQRDERNERNKRDQIYSKKHRKYPNYMNETKVSSIPRKIKVKKSPTFKSNRQRRRWNI